MPKNYRGETISGIRQLIKSAYGTGVTNAYGEPEVNWSHLSKYADRLGFDIRNKESNGSYKITVMLPRGSLLIRYGPEMGYYTAPKGTEYEELSLPYIKETQEYNEYIVVADEFPVVCKVDKGKVAPGFGSKGGGIQYYHLETIFQSVQKGILKRITK